MADVMRLKNNAPFPIGGRKPGEEWDEQCEDGVPLALFWRKRLKDEELFKAGHIAVGKPKTAVAAAPAKTKGD